MLFNKRVVDIYEYDEENYDLVSSILNETKNLIKENESLLMGIDNNSTESKTIKYINTIKSLIETTLNKMEINK